MLKRIGNCSHVIDWIGLVDSLKSQECAFVGPRHDVGIDVPGVEEVVRPLRDAGYLTAKEGGNARWDMFLVNKNFDEKIVFQFMEFVGMDSYTNAWISRVLPGDVAPWHWDVTDDENTLFANKEFIRYHCHISPPKPGHVLIVDEHCLYNQPLGEVYKWPSRKSWHAGANAGLESKYIFNIWG